MITHPLESSGCGLIVARARNPSNRYRSRMYCFFSIRSLYTIFENVSIFKELISIYYWMLSLFSCTTKPKEPILNAYFHNVAIGKMFIITHQNIARFLMEIIYKESEYLSICNLINSSYKRGGIQFRCEKVNLQIYFATLF